MQQSLLQNKLIGALVGLANAVRGNEESVTDETWNMVRQALSLMHPEAEEGAVSEMIKRIQTEKWRIVPDCAVCPSPCGRNSDYDMELMQLEGERICSLKMRMLRALRCAALSPQMDQKNCLFESLRAIGDLWEAETLEKLVISAENACG